MFNWLSELIEWIALFFPRMVIIRTTHRAVKFVRGKKLVLVEPGLCVYWPLTTDLFPIPTVRQTLNLPTQRLVTRDGKRTICSAVVVFNITDPIQAVGRSWDYEETIRDISMCAVATILTDTPYEELVKGVGSGLRVHLTDACQRGLQKFGIRIQNCMLTDFCPANVIALSNSDIPIREYNDE